MSSAAGLGGMIGASTQGTTGFLTTLEGKLEKRKAKKLEKQAGPRPTYYIPEPTLKNQMIAENRAQQGLSDASMQSASQNIDRGFGASLDALTKSGAGINSVSQLYASFADNYNQLQLMDDQARLANQNMLMQQNQFMSDELDKKWQLNVMDPWKDIMQRVAEMKTIAENKMMAGRGMIAESGATIAGTDFSGMGGGGGGNKPSGGGVQFEQQQDVYNSEYMNQQASGMGNKMENRGQPYWKRNFYLDNYA